MLSCLGQFCWRELLHERWARLLDAALVVWWICAAVAMCLECDGCKRHDNKTAEGSAVRWVRGDYFNGWNFNTAAVNSSSPVC